MNNLKTLPLLSIIIPTKNRQYTCLYSIESALKISDDNLEIIVQDCSDTDILKDNIFNKFGNDKRIQYFYSDTLPSMTENWNLAISNATGKFICGIGDDDAVLSACMDVTKWMDTNKIEAVLGSFVTYIWKDAYIGEFSNSKITYDTHYSGAIYEIDIQKEFIKKALNCGFGYTDDLPNLYHGILEKRLLEEHKINCGHYLASTSLDVYNAMILPSYTKKAFYIDYPLSIRGISGSSNSNRIYSRKDYDIHFKEFKNLTIPEMLPDVLSSEVSIAESTIIALQDLKKDSYISKLNLAIVYGKTAALDLNNFANYLNKFNLRKNTNNSKLDFFRYFFIFTKERFNNFLKQRVLKMIFFILPNANNFFEKHTSKRKVTATDIGSATQLLQKHLRDNSISIKYDTKYKKYFPLKTIWD